MIDPTSEAMILIRDVPKEIEQLTGQRPHSSTVWRYIQRGVRGVVLETILAVNKRLTSKEAVHRFIMASSRPGQAAVALNQSPSSRRRAAAADAELESDGY